MDFYRIDEKYIKFLQQYEKQKRGITKVPNIKYSDHNKFAFGAVMKINDIHYYVSVSSFSKAKEACSSSLKEVHGGVAYSLSFERNSPFCSVLNRSPPILASSYTPKR